MIASTVSAESPASRVTSSTALTVSFLDALPDLRFKVLIKAVGLRHVLERPGQRHERFRIAKVAFFNPRRQMVEHQIAQGLHEQAPLLAFHY